MSVFVKGMDLCEMFFNEIALPIIKDNFPCLEFSVGVLGYGSDVLGYDDIVSTDHMWGPRFYLFLKDEDICLKDQLYEAFANDFPYQYKGYSVNFSEPNSMDNGVRHPEFVNNGKVSPLVWIQTIDEFINDYIGKYPQTSLDWISVSEHRLLGFTSGRLFIDMINIDLLRKNLSYYPSDVKLYLIASQWNMIAEEQAFTKRCANCDDETGSRIISTRIIERLMRLCFLYKNTYAPYSKWFGSGFKQLQIGAEIENQFNLTLNSDNIVDRENYMIRAQVLVAELHNSASITNEFEIKIQNYYDREIKVLFVDRIAAMVREKINDDILRHCPLIGSFSQIGSYVELSDDPIFISKIANFYECISGN